MSVKNPPTYFFRVYKKGVEGEVGFAVQAPNPETARELFWILNGPDMDEEHDGPFSDYYFQSELYDFAQKVGADRPPARAVRRSADNPWLSNVAEYSEVMRARGDTVSWAALYQNFLDNRWQPDGLNRATASSVDQKLAGMVLGRLGKMEIKARNAREIEYARLVDELEEAVLERAEWDILPLEERTYRERERRDGLVAAAKRAIRSALRGGL